MIYKKIWITISIFILLSSFISAFAVSCKYWDEYPLKISPGDTEDVKVILQNMAGTEDITIKSSITKGSEIVSIIDEKETYFVPVGGKTEIMIRVSVPEEMLVGTEIDSIKLLFTTVTDSEKGTFGFGSSVESIIPISITEKPKSVAESGSKNNLLIYSMGIIALIILIIIFFRVIKKGKSNR